ncbi:MAG: hypothetical protein ACUVS7_18485 [Bryobacteraceae bacterium]
MIVPHLVHLLFSGAANGLSHMLRRRSYDAVISSSEEDPKLKLDEIDQMLARRVQAPAVASTQEWAKCFRRVEKQGTPCVLIDRWFRAMSANFVGVKDGRAGKPASEQLIEAGCGPIAHI